MLDSDWGEVQPRADVENAFLKGHTWAEYARWHLGLTEEATDETKSRYAFVYGDFRRVHRTGLIACQYRAAEWRHKEIETAMYAIAARLEREGYVIEAERGALRDLALAIASHELSTEQIAGWLEQRSKQI